MGEASATKRSWWKEFKGDFKKIIWPDKKSLFKQTTVVLLVTIFIGVIITILDLILKFGIGLLPLK
ncbi:preprotein translocase subunit SecE [Natranaerovirga pectinivora]|uniref:Protein translocase subunit SecE n=1 Tax=Natranaerovirga pectinivora TaxID=682400 RepID=A0A4R3MJB2_9FIRM|nr:preprotein translocase subunit SecE [Natranaerovirga pectinivora]TCT14049.1 preprotein translocase subunit SecE [Natranaerovirga pectinivora]